jgi:hypothetical protein
MEDQMARAITQFDRSNVRVIGADIVAAAQKVAAKYGITIEARGCNFSDADTTFKLRAVLSSAMIELYEKNAPRMGLPADGIGKSFKSGGRTYTITGLEPGKKFPVLSIRDDGRKYAHRTEVVVLGLLATANAATA